MHASKHLGALTAALLLSTAGAHAAEYFNRVSSFPVALNAPEAEATSAEIITATDDGMTLIYSDSPNGGIGFVDITDAKAPKQAGYLDMGGEPTSVTVIGGKAYVAVNTSESFTEPSGKLVVVDIAGQSVDGEFELGGQPDSIAHNKDNTILAIAIENERDEDVNDGAIPQAPSGYLTLVTLDNGAVTEAGIKKVELTGLSKIAPEDAEAEFVSFNDNDEVAVTMQENNYVVIVDAKTATVTGGFEAGETGVAGVDTKNDGKIDFSADLKVVPREPDAVKWLDNDRLIIANEGDWNGGSRGFTIFNRDGSIAFDSGNALDVNAAQLGHYPDFRNKKGVEPEGLEVATFGETKYIFIAEERSSLIAIYKDTGAEPEFVQSVPSGISPEGLVAIPERNLFATANEADLREDGLAGSHVMIYELGEGEPAYPQLISDLDADGHPIGWAAISGAVADAEKPGILYAVSDSVLYGEPAIYEIDATAQPARIVKKTVIARKGETAQKLDLEGITLDGEGGFWLANEGDSDKLVPHGLIHVDAEGAIQAEVGFPVDLLAGQKRFGAEGVAAIGSGDDLTLWVAVQREWGDDEKGFVKLLSYTPATKEWAAVRYPLEAAPEGGWVGLSEITVHGEYAYVVERDNQIADKAGLKAIYRVPVADLKGAELGGELPVVTKELVRDLIPDLAANNGYVVDKVESFAVDSTGKGFVITDNDGTDDSSGETFFWSIDLQ
ncbi:esterase-like activity of phytase family protein [Devosia sp. BK]|uniref:esterase-like activity of phytase family protein n=1 Tax=Devosia sp. BK TaxID=2871706 RepID=UPI00293A674B|nr:esterase-like activity of phytase family protein [Devosia sp. BK]MDV3250373.1 esterase-like activity of phytase family protein [Devosia sp. BK]